MLTMHNEIGRDTQVSGGCKRRTMYLGGSGGKGKSQVINAIKAFFQRSGCRNQLLVSATTGAAAKLITGSTIDSLCGLGRGKGTNMEEFLRRN